MCKPFPVSKHKDSELIQALGCELISAQSALNMYPEPVSQKELNLIKKYELMPFLSETDRWAKHSYKHMRQCHKYIRRLSKYINRLDYKYYKLADKHHKLKLYTKSLEGVI